MREGGRQVQRRSWTHTSAGNPVSWTVGQTQDGARTTEPLGGSGARRPRAPAQSYRETRADAASAERKLKLPKSRLDLGPSQGSNTNHSQTRRKTSSAQRAGRPAPGSEHEAPRVCLPPCAGAVSPGHRPGLPGHRPHPPLHGPFRFGGALICEPRTRRRVARTCLNDALGTVPWARVFDELA